MKNAMPSEPSEEASDTPTSFPLQALCVMADLPIRTVRYYISIGLVDKPVGETRAARYTPTHLEQLLLIKRWTAQGLSLDRIRELLSGEVEDITPLRPRRPGAVEVCSHLLISDGLELVIEPNRAQMSPEQLRRFARLVMQAHEQVMQQKPSPGI
jgi:DNA-binding transcriptional MerR regulator